MDLTFLALLEKLMFTVIFRNDFQCSLSNIVGPLLIKVLNIKIKIKLNKLLGCLYVLSK